jgi:hypothetical protein
MVLGVVVAPLLARRLATTSGGAGRLGLALITDALRLGFFFGVAILIIGLLRNRRWRREGIVSGTRV